jgi:hypothetical protein
MNWCAVETVIILLLFLANLTFLFSITLTLLELRYSLLVAGDGVAGAKNSSF